MLRYAITDRIRFPGDEQRRQSHLIEQVTTLAAQGTDFVQLREKDLAAPVLAALARKVLATLRVHSTSAPHRARLLINSRADIAVAICADGVHLTSGTGSLTPTQIRTLYAAASLPEPVVSISCHTLEEVARAHTMAATHILFGPVFEKRIGKQLISVGTGLELLQAACTLAAPIPVLALGGVTAENTPACLAAGAAGVAGIRLFAGKAG